MALQDEQQMGTASSDNHSLVTVNIHSDRLPRFSLQLTALDAAALQEKDPIELQEEFKMQVLKEPKCGHMWSALEEQGGQVGGPGGGQSSSTPTVSSHQHKALGLPFFSHLRRRRVSTVYHRRLISLYLCLQMLILATGAFQDQESCKHMEAILNEKANLSCSFLDPQDIKRLCPQSSHTMCKHMEAILNEKANLSCSLLHPQDTKRLCPQSSHTMCKHMEAILNEKANLSCSLLHPQDIKRLCPQSLHTMCKHMEAILNEKANLSCSLLYPQDIKRLCPQSSHTPHTHNPWVLCKVGRDSSVKLMGYAGQTVKRVWLEMYNGSWILIFLNETGSYSCMSKNVNSTTEHKVEVAEYGSMTIILTISALLILIGFYRKRNSLKNWCKNRSSISQPSPCLRTSQAIQTPHVPAPNTDPEDDNLHSIAIDGNADTATATAGTHDAVPGETFASPTENPYLSGNASVDTFLPADSESANACDSEAHDSAYSDSYDSASLGAEACGSAIAAFLAAGVKNEHLSKYDSQKQVEMQVFALNR